MYFESLQNTVLSCVGNSITMAQAVHQYYRQSGVPYMDLLEQFYHDMLHNSISNEGDMSKSYLW